MTTCNLIVDIYNQYIRIVATESPSIDQYKQEFTNCYDWTDSEHNCSYYIGMGEFAAQLIDDIMYQYRGVKQIYPGLLTVPAHVISENIGSTYIATKLSEYERSLPPWSERYEEYKRRYDQVLNNPKGFSRNGNHIQLHRLNESGDGYVLDPYDMYHLMKLMKTGVPTVHMSSATIVVDNIYPTYVVIKSSNNGSFVYDYMNYRVLIERFEMDLPDPVLFNATCSISETRFDLTTRFIADGQNQFIPGYDARAGSYGSVLNDAIDQSMTMALSDTLDPLDIIANQFSTYAQQREADCRSNRNGRESKTESDEIYYIRLSAQCLSNGIVCKPTADVDGSNIDIETKVVTISLLDMMKMNILEKCEYLIDVLRRFDIVPVARIHREVVEDTVDLNVSVYWNKLKKDFVFESDSNLKYVMFGEMTFVQNVQGETVQLYRSVFNNDDIRSMMNYRLRQIEMSEEKEEEVLQSERVASCPFCMTGRYCQVNMIHHFVHTSVRILPSTTPYGGWTRSGNIIDAVITYLTSMNKVQEFPINRNLISSQLEECGINKKRTASGIIFCCTVIPSTVEIDSAPSLGRPARSTAAYKSHEISEAFVAPLLRS